MSNRKIKFLVISSAAILGLLTVSGAFVWKWKKAPNSSFEKTNESIPNHPNNNSKKYLVNKIKTDLRERINQIKNSKTKPESTDWAPYVIFNDKIVCQVVGGIGFLKERESFSPADIGSKNYQEIINLISQAKEAFWGELINRRNHEYQQKVANNPNLFYFPIVSSFDSSEFFRDETSNWSLSGKQNDKHYRLIIPLNHPDLTNVPFQPLDYNFYLITGVENIPLVPSPRDGSGLYT